MEEDAPIIAYHPANVGYVLDAVVGNTDDIKDVGVIFHGKMEKSHYGVDTEIILLASSILDMMLLPVTKSLVLPAKSGYLSLEMGENIFFWRNAESLEVLVA